MDLMLGLRLGGYTPPAVAPPANDNDLDFSDPDNSFYLAILEDF